VRVMQLIPSLTVGGAERMVAILTRHLRLSGHTVSVVSMYPPRRTWIEDELRSEGVPLHFLGKRRGFDARMVPRIARILRQFRPDVLHTHMYTLKYALPDLFLRRRCRVVHTVHTLAEAELDPWSRVVQRIAFRAGVVPVAIGEAVAASLRLAYGRPFRFIIPNGIRVSDYVGTPDLRVTMRSALGVPHDAPTFVTIGMLNRAKNHRVLLRAFASERLRSAGAHLLLAGDGELRRDLEDQARMLGLQGRVHFLGVRSDVPALLAAADVFALASEREGNPLSVMEAMAAGKPIVATAVGCLPEMVPRNTGRLVDPSNVESLEAALAELACDLSLARTMGRAASKVALERFDSSSMARSYEEVYARAA
jgi:glycosyltransferase involved in cell wall biosynthesis